MSSKTSSKMIFIDPITHQLFLPIFKAGHRNASSNKFTPSDVCQVSPNCGKFEVKGSKGKHDVNFGSSSSDPHCSCKDWTAYHLPCKHFFAVFQFFSEWGWEKLRSSYLTSPYLSLDNQAMTRYFNSGKRDEADDATPSQADLSLSVEVDEIPRKVIIVCIIWKLYVIEYYRLNVIQLSI